MNHVYRLVFNVALRVWQVASELVRSAGRMVSSTIGGAVTGTVPPLRFALWMAMGFVTTLPAFAQEAQGRIVADPNAPANQRPVVLGAGNGVPVINITTPSAGGVSRNTYGQFDVGSQGAILNNARTGAETQLGGPIAGNPYLARGEARVILNEVNGPASQLNGYIEVAGKRADVIIANPAGITCAGCGFINATQATLTTGTPVFSGGSLDHYRVEGGTVRFEGKGLDATQVDYTQVIARAMEVNAEVWAQQLHAQLGANTVSATDPSQATRIDSATPAPQFLLDVGALGGMFANKIWLVGNERGMGMRNAGTIGTRADDLVVTVDGRLENSGTLQAKQNAKLSAGGGIANAGLMTASRELVINTPADVDNGGGTLNARRIEVNAQSLRNRDGEIEQTGLSSLALNAGTLSNRDGGRIGVADVATGGGEGGGASSGGGSAGGESGGGSTGGESGGGVLPDVTPLADGALNIAGVLSNDAGRINAGGGVALSMREGLDNSGGHIGLRSLSLTQGDLSNAGGTLDITGAATLHTASIDNTGGALNVGGALDVHTGDFRNAGGTLSHSGATGTVQVDGTLDNTEGAIESNAGALALGTGVLVNERGRLEHAGSDGLHLQLGTLRGANGVIVTNGAATVKVGDADHRGAVLSAAQLALTAGTFDNRGGTVATTGTGTDTLTAETFDNGEGGLIESQGDLAIKAATFGNAGGSVQHASTGTLAIDATTLNGAGGTLASNGTLRITGTTTDLRNGTTQAQTIGIDTGALTTAGGNLTAFSGDALTVAARTWLDNTGGTIATNGALLLTANALNNAGGTLNSAGTDAAHVRVTGMFDNTGGLLAGSGALTVDAGSLINRGTAGGEDGAAPMGVWAEQLAVTADTIDNANGQLGANDTATLKATTLDNTGGVVTAGNALTVEASTLNGTNGTLATNGALLLTGETTDLRGGTTSANAITVDTGTLTTAEGQLTASGAGALSLTARQQLDNTGGVIATNGALQIDAGALTNASGVLQSIGTEAAQVRVAGAFDNTSGLLAGSGALLIQAGTLINRDTLATDEDADPMGVWAESLTVAADHVDNGAGQLGANDALALTATTLDNRGGAINAVKTLSVDAATLNGENGTIASNGALTLTGETTDLRGGATFAQTMRIDTGTLTTAGATLIAAGDDPLALTVRGQLDNTGGNIAGNGALLLDAGSLTNTDGALTAAGTAATVVRVAGAFDNTRGALATAGGLTVHAGELTNVDGTIQSASEDGMTVTADGRLVNDGGSIEGNGAIALNAQSMTNADGVVQTQKAITATVADTLDNSGGTFASGDALTLKVGTLRNLDTFDGGATDPSAQKGLFGRQVAIEAATLDNTRGQIQAGEAADLTGTNLSNAGGLIGGVGAVTVNAATFDNAGGSLIQYGESGALNLTATQGLNNTAGGVIGAEGTATLAAGTLNNSGGTVFARHGLEVGTDGDLINRDAGLLQSGGAMTIRAGTTFDNSGGALDATGAAQISAANVSNVGGQVLAGAADNAEAALTISTLGVLDNRGGTVASRGGDVALQAAAIDNRDAGLLVAQRDLTLGIGSVNNAGGTTYATRHLRYENPAGTLDNSGGLFGSGDTTWLNLAGLVNANNGQIDAGTLWLTLPALDTTGGEIRADALNLNVGSLTGTGRLFGGQGLSLAFNGDFTYANGLRLESNGTLSLTVGGTFTNQGTWQTASVLNINAGNVINEGTLNASNANGTGETHVTASGTIDNRTGASIEGDTVVLTANDVTNTGDITGNYIVIDANTLTNGRDLGTAQPARAYGEGFIGATELLDLRIGNSLHNLDGELFSLGGMVITGRGGTGRVGDVVNRSGRIQAEGDLSIATNSLLNERRVLNFTQGALTPEEQAAMTLETFGEDAASYSEGSAQAIRQVCGPRGDRCLRILEINYTEYATPTDGLFVDTVSATPAALLQSGGNMSLDASSVRNRFATITAGQNLWINGQSQGGGSGESAPGVSNESVTGQTTYKVTAVYDIGYQPSCGSGDIADCQFEWYNQGGSLDFGTVTRTYSPAEGRATISAGGALTIITDGDVNNQVVLANDPRSGINVGQQGGPGATRLGTAGGKAVGSTDGVGRSQGGKVRPSGALQLALTDLVNGADNPANAAAQVVGTPERPLPGLVPPDNGMYDVAVDPNAPFLVSTAPRFASKGDWTSSNYLLGLLGAQDIHKRLGDGYYEQMMVMDQILQLTGRRSLSGGMSALAQYTSLMDGAAAEAARLGMQLGAPLTSTQIAALSQDIVWLVEMEVDGQRVLVPVVYLSSATAERLRNDGALMAGDTVDIQTTTKLNNDGTIAGNRGTWLSADSLINNGAIRADNGRLDIMTRGDTTNYGSMSGHSVVIDAGGSVVNQPTFDGLAWRGGQIEAGRGGMAINAALDVVNRGQIASAGNAAISAGRDAVFGGKSTTSAGGYLFIDAGRHIVGEAVTETTTRTQAIAYGRRTTVDEKVTGATFQAGNDLVMRTKDGNIDVTAGTIRSEDGGVVLYTEHGDVNLRDGKESHHLVEDTKQTKKGTFSKTTTTTHLEVHDTVSVGTTVSGKTVDILGDNVLVQGSTVVSDDRTAVTGRQNVSFLAGENTHDESFSQTKTKSGVFSDGGVGFTIGKAKHGQTADVHQVTHTGSVVGSIEGRVDVYAGQHYQQTGSDVIGMAGVGISGATVTIENAVDTLDVHETQKSSSGGIHVSIKGGAATAAATAYGSLNRAGEVEDDRLSALYTAQAAQSLFGASGQNAFGDAADMMKNGGPSQKNNGGMSLRIGIGGSSSKAESDTHQTTSHGSTVSSRGTTSVIAREGDLTAIGSTIEGVNTVVGAAGNLLLLSAEEANEMRQKNSAKSGEVGFTMGSEAGMGVYVSASAAKGKGQGEGASHAEAVIRGSDTTTFFSGGDTIGKGAQIIGDKVVGRVGGDFLLSSDQDRNDYQRNDQSAGVDAAVGIGGGSVSVNYAQGKLDSNYTSVERQTGVQAGKQGFDIQVDGHTQLDGAAIASQADPSRNRFETGSLGFTDLKNEADYKATSVSVSASGGSNGGSGSGSAMQQKDKASSTTKAGIADGTLIVHDGSGSDIARGVTELQQDGLKQIYDERKVAETMEMGQVAGQVAFTAVGDYAKSKTADYENAERTKAIADKKLEDPNLSEPERTHWTQVSKDSGSVMATNQAQYDAWKDGSTNKAILHAVSGALSAGLGGGSALDGALGAAAAELARPLTADENKLVQSLVSFAIGGAVGGTSGASTGLSGEVNNRMLHSKATNGLPEVEHIKELAGGDPERELELWQAACALAKCSAGIPTDDPSYPQWLALETAGNQPDRQEDRDRLESAVGAVRHPDPTYRTEGSIEDGWMYQYGTWDAIADASSRNQLGTRAMGGLQMVGGAFQSAGGLLLAPTCETVLGCIASGYLVGAGADNASTGWMTMLNGKPMPTLGGKALQATLGMSPEAAELLYGATQLAPATAEAMVLNRIANAEAAANIAARATYAVERFGTQGLQVTSEVMGTPQAQALVREYLAAGVSPDKAMDYAADLLQSGKGLPVAVSAGPETELIKLVPKRAMGGDPVGETSPFFVTREQYESLSKLPADKIADALGLPAEQGIRGAQLGFDAYSMQPLPGAKPTFFTSEVAPAQQGAYSSSGGAQQVLVPNRSLWTDPNSNKIGEITGGRWQ